MDILPQLGKDAKHKIQTGLETFWTPGGHRVFRDCGSQFAGDAVELCRRLTGWPIEKCIERAKVANAGLQTKEFYHNREELSLSIAIGREEAHDLYDRGVIDYGFGDWSVIGHAELQQCFPRLNLNAVKHRKKGKTACRLLVRPDMDPYGRWAAIMIYALEPETGFRFLDHLRFPGFEDCPIITPADAKTWPEAHIALGENGEAAGAAEHAGLSPCFQFVDVGSRAWNGSFPQRRITFVSTERGLAGALHCLSSTTSVDWLDLDRITKLRSVRKGAVDLAVPLPRGCRRIAEESQWGLREIIGHPFLSPSGRGMLIAGLEECGAGSAAELIAAAGRQAGFDGWTYYVRGNCVWKSRSAPGGTTVEHQVTNFVVEPTEDVVVDGQLRIHCVRVIFDTGAQIHTLIPVPLVRDSQAYLDFLRSECVKRGAPRPVCMQTRDSQCLPQIFDSLFLGAPSLTHMQSGRGKHILPGSAMTLRLAGRMEGTSFLGPSDQPRFVSETLVREAIRGVGLVTLNNFGRGLRQIHGHAVERVDEQDKKGWVIPPATEKEKEKCQTPTPRPRRARKKRKANPPSSR